MRCWIDSAGRRRTCDSVPCKVRPSMHGPVYVNVYPLMAFVPGLSDVAVGRPGLRPLNNAAAGMAREVGDRTA